jgi:hypothetical protein
MGLRRKYYELTSEQRLLVMIGALALYCGVLFLLVLNPQIKSYKKAQMDNKRVANAGDTMNKKRIELKTLGRKKVIMDSSRLEILRANGNEVLLASKVSEYLEILRDTNDRLGGRNCTIDEGPIESAYISMNGRRDVYKVMRLPVKISFESDYSVLSNYLFQLQTLKHLMKLGEVEIHSKGYSGDLRVSVNLGIYFIEES